MTHSKYVTYLFLVLVIALFAIGCIDTDINTNMKEGITVNNNTSINSAEPHLINSNNQTNANSVEDYNISTANNDFAFEMYTNIKNGSENVFFSPYSIFTAMAICYDGAQGSTKEQISTIFHFPLSKTVLETSSKELVDTINSNNEDYELDTANALWIQESYPLREEFVNNSKNYYNGNVNNLDFEEDRQKTAAIINQWAEGKTNDKIKGLISADMIIPNTTMIVTNTVYFKGKWLYEFSPQLTQKVPFYTSGGEQTSVDMMHTTEYYNYGENENEKIIEMPYKGEDLSMYIVLPEQNNISELENRFSPAEYNELKASMESQNEVDLWIPKFTLDTKTKLSNPLQKMGIIDAFSESADFSLIYDKNLVPEGHNLTLSEIIHQANINVQEEGTEAAAATAVGAYVTSPPPGEEIEFIADHPFMFFIEDRRTGCILFMGKIEYPEIE